MFYYLNLAPTIYCGLKRLATILGARFRYYNIFVPLLVAEKKVWEFAS
jgi:hypothetical protein